MDSNDQQQTWVSEREAAALLAPAGLSRESARKALRAGAAGDSVKTRGSRLYDADVVRALAGREPLHADELPDQLAPEVLILRIGDDRLQGLTQPGQRLAAVADGWIMSPSMRLLPGTASTQERTRLHLEPSYEPWAGDLMRRPVPKPRGSAWTMLET